MTHHGTHHGTEHEGVAVDDRHVAADADHDNGGLEVEKWILRLMLMTVAALAVSAVLASLDDIKRYVRIKQM